MTTIKTNSKLDTAIAKSRAKDGVIDVPAADEPTTALAALQNVAIETFDPNVLVEMIKAGTAEAGERVLELQENTMVRGQLLGRGPMAMVQDPVTGKDKAVATWRMRLTSGARVSFLTSAQLDRQLPEFIGRKGEMCIARGGTVKTKKNRNMSEFYVVGPAANAPRLTKEEMALPVSTEEHEGVVADEPKADAQ